MKNCFLLCLLAINSVLFAQVPIIEWETSIGGSIDDRPGNGNSLQETTDGGFIVVGRSNSSDINVTLNQWLFDAWV